MLWFFKSPAGKGTLGVCLTCAILVWPLLGTWLVAGLTLTFAVVQFRESFRRLDAADRAAAGQLGSPAAANVPAVTERRRPPGLRGVRQG